MRSALITARSAGLERHDNPTIARIRPTDHPPATAAPNEKPAPAHGEPRAQDLIALGSISAKTPHVSHLFGSQKCAIARLVHLDEEFSFVRLDRVEDGRRLAAGERLGKFDSAPPGKMVTAVSVPVSAVMRAPTSTRRHHRSTIGCHAMRCCGHATRRMPAAAGHFDEQAGDFGESAAGAAGGLGRTNFVGVAEGATAVDNRDTIVPAIF